MSWMGAGFLIGGAVLSIYGFVTVQSVFDELRALSIPPFQAFPFLSAPSPFLVLETRLFFVQFLQLVGLVMVVLGSVMLAFGLGVKERRK